MKTHALLVAFYPGAGPDNDALFKKLKMQADKIAEQPVFTIKAKNPALNNSRPLIMCYPPGGLYALTDAEQIPALIETFKSGAQVPDDLVYDDNDSSTAHSINGSLFRMLADNMADTEERICGKCCPCRLGGPRIHDLLILFDKGEALLAHISLLDATGTAMKQASLCAVGMFGADALLFALKHFTSVFTAAVEAAASVPGTAAAPSPILS
jgi:hypothetical protein